MFVTTQYRGRCGKVGSSRLLMLCHVQTLVHLSACCFPLPGTMVEPQFIHGIVSRSLHVVTVYHEPCDNTCVTCENILRVSATWQRPATLQIMVKCPTEKKHHRQKPCAVTRRGIGNKRAAHNGFTVEPLVVVAGFFAGSTTSALASVSSDKCSKTLWL